MRGWRSENALTARREMMPRTTHRILAIYELDGPVPDRFDPIRKRFGGIARTEKYQRSGDIYEETKAPAKKPKGK